MTANELKLDLLTYQFRLGKLSTSEKIDEASPFFTAKRATWSANNIKKDR
jgi:hypothetical protein